jgi:hypothetical protein
MKRARGKRSQIITLSHQNQSKRFSNAVFITDISRAVFTTTNMKSDTNLGFLSTFVPRWVMIEGLKIKMD